MALVRKYRSEFESEFSWVTKDPDGSEMAYCEMCEISITPTSSCLSTHESSARHQKNAYDIKTTGQKSSPKHKSDGPRPSAWKREYDESRKFKDEWLDMFPWIEKDPENERFGYCPYCKLRLEPKARRIEDHEKTYKHQVNSGIKDVKATTDAGDPAEAATEAEVEADEVHDELQDRSEFDKIHDISELMDGLPTLLEGEDQDEVRTGGDLKEAETFPEQTAEEHKDPEVTVPPRSEDVASTSEQVRALPQLPPNKFSAEFPWVILAEEEDSFPYCPYCGVFVEPQPDQLRKHQETRKHIKMEKIGFPEEKKSSGGDRGRKPDGSRSTSSKSASDSFVKNPPTKRVLALQHKKKQMQEKLAEESLALQEFAHENVETTITEQEPLHDDDAITMMDEYEEDLVHDQPVTVEYVKVLMSQPGTDDFVEVGRRELEESERKYEIQPVIKEEHQDFDEKFIDYTHEGTDDRTTPRRAIKRESGDRNSSWKREYEKTRRFQSEWFKVHPWVRHEKRPNNVEMAFCPYCNIDLEPRIVRLRQHENTRKHRKNAEIHSKRVLLEENLARQGESRRMTSVNAKAEVRPRYKCDLCNLRFVAQRNLYLHLKDHYETSTKENVIVQPAMQPQVVEKTVEVQSVKPEIKLEYKPAWERIFPWLQKAVDDEWAFCSLCKFPMEPKLSVIKAHLKHRRHVKLVAQQEDPTKFIPKPDMHGVLAEEEKKDVRKRNSVAGHADVVIDSDGKEKYQCKTCKKILVKTSFAVHMRIHQGIRPFKCTMCEWAFKQAYDLKHHVESVHNGIKAHQCELCGKEFTRKYTLRLHLKSHTDVRDFRCSHCTRGFFTRGKLIEHERTHTGEKPFLCDFCGRGFRIKYDMVQHRLKTHFGLQPKRRKSAMPKMETVPATTTTTTYITTTDGVLDEKTTIMTVDDAVEVDMTGHTIVHSIDGVVHEPKHQLVFISENEAVFLTK